MRKYRWLLIAALALAAIVVWNFPLTYRVGVDGKLFVKEIPFYAKMSGFLYRDWMYRNIVREAAGTARGQTEKALAILGWLRDNVKYGIPEGLKCVDDHPLNIVIRQFGAKDQVEDIFTILCSYAGLKAIRKKCYGPDGKRSIIFSFVQADCRWLIIDAASNKYFLNKEGKIASVEDYLKGDLILSDEDKAKYEEVLKSLKHITLSQSMRADEQMPLRRIGVRLKKTLGNKQQDEENADN